MFNISGDSPQDGGLAQWGDSYADQVHKLFNSISIASLANILHKYFFVTLIRYLIQIVKHISITSLANILHCSSFPIAHEIHKYIYHSMDRCHLMQRSIQNTPQDRMTR